MEFLCSFKVVRNGAIVKMVRFCVKMLVMKSVRNLQATCLAQRMWLLLCQMRIDLVVKLGDARKLRNHSNSRRSRLKLWMLLLLCSKCVCQRLWMAKMDILKFSTHQDSSKFYSFWQFLSASIDSRFYISLFHAFQDKIRFPGTINSFQALLVVSRIAWCQPLLS